MNATENQDPHAGPCSVHSPDLFVFSVPEGFITNHEQPAPAA